VRLSRWLCGKIDRIVYLYIDYLASAHALVLGGWLIGRLCAKIWAAATVTLFLK
jgi:hypothetical protein